ncbi:hypothetical protein H9C73_02515 [Marinobacterium sp. AK62]|uniref:Uncharacterized protein n=1 Tax=Marinobacterium alkalitolerans TaxID=1542925 RepID=A0ABS3Z7C6_9GAMM|nr:hypothetical protein [Marinobacterium alkalitolerans]MBP0047597.1 hypothetical protein [Marinobacterium alkalitolerans]
MTERVGNNTARKVYQALCLTLLMALVLTAQLLTLSHASGMETPVSPQYDMFVHCEDTSGSDCAAPEPADCCSEALDRCALECTQMTAWVTVPITPLPLMRVRAIPPPATQLWSDIRPDPPYQPPRTS